MANTKGVIMRKSGSRASYLFVTSLLFSLYSRAIADAPAKLPVPDANAQTTAAKLVEEIYATELNSARSSVQKSTLAHRMLADAIETSDDTAGRYVLFDRAIAIAAGCGDIELTLQSIEQLNGEYEIDELQVSSAALVALARADSSRDHHQALIPLSRELIAAAIAQDRYDVADRMSQLAVLSARRTRDASLLQLQVAQINDIESLKKEFARVQSSLATLKAHPADQEANSTVGQYYCFVKGNWDDGLPLLAIGSDPALKSLAETELAAAASASDQVQLGDEWWNRAENKTGIVKQNLTLHAQHLYKMALPGLTGLTELKVRKRLDGIVPIDQPKSNLPEGTLVAFDFEKQSVTKHAGKSTLRDLSGVSGDGEFVNGKIVPGVHGSAIRFERDGVVRFPDASLPKADSPRSVLLWARVAQFHEPQVLFVYGGNRHLDASYLIVFPDGDGQGRAQKLSVGNPGGRNESAGKAIVSDGKWHHLGLIYDGSGTAQIFIDGQSDLAFSRRYNTSASGDAFIGTFFGGHPTIDGAFDDFLILDRAASAEEINQIMENGLIRK